MRRALIEALHDNKIDPDEFREVQRAIGARNGTGCGAIARTLGMNTPEI